MNKIILTFFISISFLFNIYLLSTNKMEQFSYILNPQRILKETGMTKCETVSLRVESKNIIYEGYFKFSLQYLLSPYFFDTVNNHKKLFFVREQNNIQDIQGYRYIKSFDFNSKIIKLDYYEFSN